jgi:hypothetical protein
MDPGNVCIFSSNDALQKEFNFFGNSLSLILSFCNCLK